MTRQAERLLGVLCGLALLAPAGAQAPVKGISEVSAMVAGAEREVMLAVGVLRSRVLAEALREALVVRGVNVYILAGPGRAEAPASYLMSLALAGASVRLSEPAADVLVVDRRRAVTGPLLASLDGATPPGKAVRHEDAAGVRRQVGWFYRSFTGAPPYVPSLPVPGGGR